MTKNQKRMILPIIIVVLVVLMLALSIIFLGADTFIILSVISASLISACLAVLIAYTVVKFIILYVLAGVLTDNELKEVKFYLDCSCNTISNNTLNKILNYLKNKLRTSKCKFIYKKMFLFFDEILIRKTLDK